MVKGMFKATMTKIDNILMFIGRIRYNWDNSDGDGGVTENWIFLTVGSSTTSNGRRANSSEVTGLPVLNCRSESSSIVSHSYGTVALQPSIKLPNKVQFTADNWKIAVLLLICQMGFNPSGFLQVSQLVN